MQGIREVEILPMQLNRVIHSFPVVNHDVGHAQQLNHDASCDRTPANRLRVIRVFAVKPRQNIGIDSNHVFLRALRSSALLDQW